MSFSTERLQPVAICTCGHEHRYHYANGGSCLCAHKLKSGKYADATVCSCSSFKEKA